MSVSEFIFMYDMYTLLSNFGPFNFGTAVKFEIVKYAKQI